MKVEKTNLLEYSTPSAEYLEICVEECFAQSPYALEGYAGNDFGDDVELGDY